MIYAALHLTLLASMLIGFVKSWKKFSKISCFYIFFVWVCFVSLGFSVGQDYHGYESIFYDVPDIFSVSTLNLYFEALNAIHGEYGFLVLNSVLKSLGFSFNSVYLVNSLVSLFIVFIVCIWSSDKPQFGLLIYFSMFFMTLQFVQIRLGFVVSLYLLAFVLLATRHYLVSFFIIVCGIFYQKILAVSILFYFLLRAPYLLVISLLFILSWILFFLSPLSFILGIIGGIELNLLSQVLHYAGKDKYSGNNFPVLAYCFRFCLLVLMVSMYRRTGETSRLVELGFVSFSLGLFCLVSFWELSFLAVRFNTIFSVVLVVLIPKVFMISRSRLMRLTLLFLMSTYCVYSFYSTIFNESNGFLPYKSILGI